MENKELDMNVEVENKETENLDNAADEVATTAEIAEETAEASEAEACTEEAPEENATEENATEEANAEAEALTVAPVEQLSEQDIAEGNKLVALFKEKTKNVNWKKVWDKVTTGILILIMAAPILILAYIFIWFLTK